MRSRRRCGGQRFGPGGFGQVGAVVAVAERPIVCPGRVETCQHSGPRPTFAQRHETLDRQPGVEVTDGGPADAGRALPWIMLAPRSGHIARGP